MTGTERLDQLKAFIDKTSKPTPKPRCARNKPATPCTNRTPESAVLHTYVDAAKAKRDGKTYEHGTIFVIGKSRSDRRGDDAAKRQQARRTFRASVHSANSALPACKRRVLRFT